MTTHTETKDKITAFRETAKSVLRGCESVFFKEIHGIHSEYFLKSQHQLLNFFSNKFHRVATTAQGFLETAGYSWRFEPGFEIKKDAEKELFDIKSIDSFGLSLPLTATGANDKIFSLDISLTRAEEIAKKTIEDDDDFDACLTDDHYVVVVKLDGKGIFSVKVIVPHDKRGFSAPTINVDQQQTSPLFEMVNGLGWNGKDLRTWQSRLNLTNIEAADLLGIGRSTYVTYLARGEPIHRSTMLACMILETFFTQQKEDAMSAYGNNFMKAIQLAAQKTF